MVMVIVIVMAMVGGRDGAMVTLGPSDISTSIIDQSAAAAPAGGSR